mgnify:CR=1 FL=1
MQSGSSVTTTQHPYKMSVKIIDGDLAICNYFIGSDVFEGHYKVADLTLVD